MAIFQIKFENPQFDVSFHYEVDYIHHETPGFLWMLRQATGLSLNMGVDRIEFKKVASNYRYKITFIDGRIWEQTIIFDKPNDPNMSFSNVTGNYRVGDFAYIRELRTSLIDLKNLYEIDNYLCRVK